MRILVFTEGTIIMHRSGLGQPREQIVIQSAQGKDPALRDWSSYVPVGNAPQKLKTWISKGAELFYLTSRRSPNEVKSISSVLMKNGFPEAPLLYRRRDEQYGDVAKKAKPQIIIEDDCESIGGKEEMTYTNLKPELKKNVKSIAVPEFGGIDHLPDKVDELGVWV